jgi:hypothetical protein
MSGRGTLAAVVAALLFGGCGEEDDKPFTMTGPVNFGTGNPGDPPVIVVRGKDGGAAAEDAAPEDAAVDAAPAVDAETDAAPDAAPPEPDAAPPLSCSNVRDCAVAVDLTSCDACPIPALTIDVANTRCLVPHQAGLSLGQYQPADCYVGCRQPGAIVCNEPPALPQCAGGVCRLLR